MNKWMYGTVEGRRVGTDVDRTQMWMKSVGLKDTKATDLFDGVD